MKTTAQILEQLRGEIRRFEDIAKDHKEQDIRRRARVFAQYLSELKIWIMEDFQ